MKYLVVWYRNGSNLLKITMMDSSASQIVIRWNNEPTPSTAQNKGPFNAVTSYFTEQPVV
jgi:hypothetical protein